MFALRGIAVSLTFFVLVYCLLSAVVLVCWRWLQWLHATERSLSEILFLLRIFPLVASAIVTFAFVVPSFQILEPRSADEGLGTMPFLLGLVALFFFAYGTYRVVTAQTRTSRIVARWLEGSVPLNGNSQAITLRSPSYTPPLTLVGLCKPRVLVSDSTLAMLSSGELEIALRHEVAHIRSRDNIKKLIFRFAPFPGMKELESAWSQAAELAADDAAVTSLNDAVDLAAALVKLSRLIPVEPAPACTVGFVTGSVRARVTRLLAWNEADRSHQRTIPRWFAFPPLVVAIAAAILAYGPVLSMTHEITEWLVR